MIRNLKRYNLKGMVNMIFPLRPGVVSTLDMNPDKDTDTDKQKKTLIYTNLYFRYFSSHL
jgi:hypothetical protein